MTAENASNQGLNFEDALNEINEIVEKLESGELPLDDSLELFSRGMKLIDFCSQKLTEAESKLKVLLKGADGSFTTRDFE
jgi:exodeoxyribonuclease VII small subunit